MARGWGKNEEDLAAEKEQAREERGRAAGSKSDALLEARRRSLKLSLARVQELLEATKSPARRQALEAAREELLERLQRL